MSMKPTQPYVDENGFTHYNGYDEDGLSLVIPPYTPNSHGTKQLTAALSVTETPMAYNPKVDEEEGERNVQEEALQCEDMELIAKALNGRTKEKWVNISPHLLATLMLSRQKVGVRYCSATWSDKTKTWDDSKRKTTFAFCIQADSSERMGVNGIGLLMEGYKSDRSWPFFCRNEENPEDRRRLRFYMRINDIPNYHPANAGKPLKRKIVWNDRFNSEISIPELDDLVEQQHTVRASMKSMGLKTEEKAVAKKEAAKKAPHTIKTAKRTKTNLVDEEAEDDECFLGSVFSTSRR